MDNSDQFLITLHRWMGIFMHNSMHNAIRFSKDSGWSMSQIGALMMLHKEGACPVSDIGEALGISNPAASQMIDRLVQDGLILRTEDPHDRRVKQIRLTDKGVELVQKSLQARHVWLHKLSEQLTDGEKQQINQALEIMIEKTRKIDTQASGIPKPE